MQHMEVVPEAALEVPDDQSFYLPHHCVFKEDSTTTKLRVVFDGSAKTSSGISLNDALMVGPTIQDDLFAILMRFRIYPIALSADIAKMYRQVALDETDRNFHRILWRDDETQKLQILRMTRVTYGIASSAFHSTRCLADIADKTSDEVIKYHIKHGFYVDDFFGGSISTDEARILIHKLCEVLNEYGFPLRKWVSNNPNLIREIPAELRESADEVQIFSENYKVKALGMSWKPNKDIFYFTTDLEKPQNLTKRTMLSLIAKLFDPHGFLSPVIIKFKILIQRIWVHGTKWDDNVPPEIATDFECQFNELSEIHTIQLPRPIVKINLSNFSFICSVMRQKKHMQQLFTVEQRIS